MKTWGGSMEEKKNHHLLGFFLRENMGEVLMFVALAAIATAVFALYDLEMEPVCYAFSLCALITEPKLILADEPSGSLDSKSTDSLLEVFRDINYGGQTILMVTHSTKAASNADRVLFIKDGEIFHQIYRGNCSNEQLYQKISDTLTLLTTGGEQK
jgi:ABC-type ATPase involved in cell division